MQHIGRGDLCTQATKHQAQLFLVGPTGAKQNSPCKATGGDKTTQTADEKIRESLTVLQDLVCQRARVVDFDSAQLAVNPGKAFSQRESSCAVLTIRDKTVSVKFHALTDPESLTPLVRTVHEFHFSHG